MTKWHPSISISVSKLYFWQKNVHFWKTKVVYININQAISEYKKDKNDKQK